MNALAAHVEARRQPAQPNSAALPETIREGVTASWLAQAFNMSIDLVRYRLRKCPVKATKARGERQVTTLYDLKDAAAFLVSPTLTTKDLMASLRKGDLPPALQVTVWEALLKRQKVEENAGDLWRTDKVQAVFGSTFQSLKFNIQLWADTVERQIGLTEDQRKLIVELGDVLQRDIYESLVQNMKNSATGSQLDEIKDWVGEDETADEIIHGTPVISAEERAEIEALI